MVQVVTLVILAVSVVSVMAIWCNQYSNRSRFDSNGIQLAIVQWQLAVDLSNRARNDLHC